MDRDLQYICADCNKAFDTPETLSEPQYSNRGVLEDECCPYCGNVNIIIGLE